MKINRIARIICFLAICLYCFNYVFAACEDCDAEHCGLCGRSCSIVEGKCISNNTPMKSDAPNSWWYNANRFLSNYSGTQSVSSYFSGLQGLVELIQLVGNMIFVAVTVILGVKYIWGGIESKASVKESLVTLVTASLVFYGWNTISALFKNATGTGLNFVAETAGMTASNIYSLVMFVANFLAVGGLIYIGIRYMMAGAEGRAELKAKGVPIVLGIIMVYATITFLNLIVSII